MLSPSVTYNGVAMTQLAQILAGPVPTLFYLLNPATGTHTVSVSGTGFARGMSVSFTGVHQTYFPDANAVSTLIAQSSGTVEVARAYDKEFGVLMGNDNGTSFPWRLDSDGVNGVTTGQFSESGGTVGATHTNRYYSDETLTIQRTSGTGTIYACLCNLPATDAAPVSEGLRMRMSF